MAKIVYLRTDKNGTKYYANYTCPRCGGAGGSDKWAFTGWTCYECGGTGESSTPVIEKEYTPEYRATSDNRNRNISSHLLYVHIKIKENQRNMCSL